MTMVRLLIACLLALVAVDSSAAFKAPNSVKETTTTTGTGTVDLAGASTGYVGFASQLSTGDTTWYTIYDASGNVEVGLGTFTDASPDTLARTSILWSTNSNAAVSFGAGSKDVIAALPGSFAQSLYPTAADQLLASTAAGTPAWAAISSPGTSGCSGTLDKLVYDSTTHTFRCDLDQQLTGLTIGQRVWMGGDASADLGIGTSACGSLDNPCHSLARAIARATEATTSASTAIMVAPGYVAQPAYCSNYPQYDHDGDGDPSCTADSDCNFGTCSSHSCSSTTQNADNSVGCDSNGDCSGGKCITSTKFARQCSNGANDGRACWGTCTGNSTVACQTAFDCPLVSGAYDTCSDTQPSGSALCLEETPAVSPTASCTPRTNIVVLGESPGTFGFTFSATSADVSNAEPAIDLGDSYGIGLLGVYVGAVGNWIGAIGSTGGAQGVAATGAAAAILNVSHLASRGNPFHFSGHGNTTVNLDGNAAWVFMGTSDAAVEYFETSGSNANKGICSADDATLCDVADGNADCTGHGGTCRAPTSGCKAGVCATTGAICDSSADCSGATCYRSKCSSGDFTSTNEQLQGPADGWRFSTVDDSCTTYGDCGSAYNIRVGSSPLTNLGGNEALDTLCSTWTPTEADPYDSVACLTSDNYCAVDLVTACPNGTGTCASCEHMPGTCSGNASKHCNVNGDCTSYGGTCNIAAGKVTCESAYGGTNYCRLHTTVDATAVRSDVRVDCRGETATGCGVGVQVRDVVVNPNSEVGGGTLSNDRSFAVLDGGDIQTANARYDESREYAENADSTILDFFGKQEIRIADPSTLSAGHIPYFTTSWSTATIGSVIETYAGLTNLSDVALSGVATGHVIRYDSGAWGNATMGSAVNTAVAAAGFTDAQIEALLRNSTTGTDSAINVCDLKGQTCTATGNGSILGKYSGAWDTRAISTFTEDATNGVGLADLNNVGGLTGTDRFLFANASADTGPWAAVNGAALGGDGIAWDATNNEFDTDLADTTGLDVATGGYTVDLTELTLSAGLDATATALDLDLTELTLGSGLDSTATGLDLDFTELTSALFSSSGATLGINTADQADAASLVLTASSAQGAARAASIRLYGNEFTAFSLNGAILIDAGDGEGAAASCTSNGVPWTCCTGSGVGATCPAQKGDIYLRVDQTSDAAWMRFTDSEKLEVSGDAPAVSGCGTSPSIVGNNISGVVTTGTGSPTECILTFDDGAWANAPQCFFNSRVTTYGVVYAKTISTTAVTMDWETGTPAGVAFDYHCHGYY